MPDPRTSSPRRLARRVAALLTVAALLGLVVPPAQALLPVPQLVFGAVGIVAGQAVRVNVSNVMGDGSVRPGPVRVLFLDMAGAVRKSAEGSVGPGETAVFDATAEDIVVSDGGTREPRYQAHAVVQHPPSPCRQSPVATMEIFDATTGQSTGPLLPAVQSAREGAGR